MKKLLLVSIMCLVSLCGLFSYTYAQEENQDLTKEAILTFASDITVHEDNSIDVIETLVYNTGTSARHGIYRDIDTASSQMRKMSIENIAVTDENNVPYLFEVIRDSGTIGIKIGAAVLGLVLAKFMGIGIIILVIFAAVGMWFSKWYIKRGKMNTTLVNIILWANVITWLLPPLGLLTGFATLGFSEHFVSQKKKFMILSIIAIVLALANGFFGAIMA